MLNTRNQSRISKHPCMHLMHVFCLSHEAVVVLTYIRAFLISPVHICDFSTPNFARYIFFRQVYNNSF